MLPVSFPVASMHPYYRVKTASLAQMNLDQRQPPRWMSLRKLNPGSNPTDPD
ncbi:hypothetical protein [Moorena producens]|uniref:hypothetical protein n=1 Tax=Moorena producens TaxID=1155739 RepID=UPI001313E154|nr:hypothetical protein [Moorena producens]